MTSLSGEVKVIADRLARVDRGHPTIDHTAVEGSLREHLRACGLPTLPILWMTDAEEGYGRGALGRANRNWRRVSGEIERKLDDDGVDGAWQARVLAWPLAWSQAETVVTDLVETSVTRSLGKARRPAGTAASGAVRALGWIAAAAMSPRGVMSLFVDRCLRIYRPFISAYEAGPLALLGARG